MFDFLARLRQLRSSRTLAPRYEIVCLCDTRLAGLRGRAPQVVRCPGCGRDNFILPQSPLPAVAAPGDKPAALRPPSGKRRAVWLVPLATALLFLGLGGAYLAVRWFLPLPAQEKSAAAALERHRSRGRTALSDGNFQVAAGELHIALGIAERDATLLRPAQFRQLAQLHRQAALLADLLHEPLTDLLQLAAGLADQEWQAVFKRTYQTKAVVFDAEVRRTADGQYEISYVIWDGKAAARLHLEDVHLLKDLPLDRPQRLIFGVRLAEVQRRAEQWHLRLVPESGVLFTDQPAVEACLFVTGDEELREVLERQAEWLRERH